jgi:hypothetical protein
MDFSESNVNPATMRNWLLSVANDAAFVPAVEHDAWPTVPPCWWMMYGKWWGEKLWTVVPAGAVTAK